MVDHLDLYQTAKDIADDRYSWLKESDFLVRLVKFSVIFGGGLAAIAQLVPSDFKVSAFQWFGIFGAAVSTIAGIGITNFERDMPKILERAQRATDIAKSYAANQESLSEIFNDLENSDEKRRRLMASTISMLEMIDQFRAVRPKSIDVAVEKTIELVLHQLVPAMGLTNREIWSLTVFKLDHSLTPPQMRCLKKWHVDRQAQSKTSRNWEKGVGFTGLAWSREDKFCCQTLAHQLQKAFCEE